MMCRGFASMKHLCCWVTFVPKENLPSSTTCFQIIMKSLVFECSTSTKAYTFQTYARNSNLQFRLILGPWAHWYLYLQHQPSPLACKCDICCFHSNAMFLTHYAMLVSCTFDVYLTRLIHCLYVSNDMMSDKIMMHSFKHTLLNRPAIAGSNYEKKHRRKTLMIIP